MPKSNGNEQLPHDQYGISVIARSATDENSSHSQQNTLLFANAYDLYGSTDQQYYNP